ncbi:MAG: phosphoglucosamine mutase [Candidatus Palauibacterales bacterium]|nr:phosphoglucosamine mutase [Candidatus Palauibacterales bacterium]MDP2530676.1 phosphoglucosamine mutase [Candidatus Palauibacterales bacterium]
MHEPLIVSASGIRGVVGDGLTPEIAARYGAAYGTFLASVRGDAGGHVILARDSRTSGPLLVDAVAAGVRSAGWPVVDVGLAPTPTALLAVQDDDRAAGGVIVTASHNPVQWNGLKLASSAGEFVSVEGGRRVQALFSEGPDYAAWDGLGGRVEREGAVEHHVERILALSIVDREAIAAAGFVVALDSVRGAGGPIMSLLLDRLGCRVEGLDLEPDGRFRRPPEPVPENLGDLSRWVRETGADVGLAVDPDVDRLALVDGEGMPVGEDWTLALAVEYVLSKTPGPVVTNLSSSRVISDAARRAGQPVHLAPVGEANVARRMRETGAVVGGEGNGGVMLPALHLTRDAPLAACLVLGLLAAGGVSLEGWLADRPHYAIAKRRTARPEGSPEALYGALLADAPTGASEDRQDGLRLDWPGEGRWVHVRPSGTEPILRVIAEAPTAGEADDLAAWALARAATVRGDPSPAAG